MIHYDPDAQGIVIEGIGTVDMSADDVLDMARRLENEVLPYSIEGGLMAAEAAVAETDAILAGVEAGLEEALAERWEAENDRGGLVRVGSVPPGFLVCGLDVTRPTHWLPTTKRPYDKDGLCTLTWAGGERIYASIDRVLAMSPAEMPDPPEVDQWR